MHAVSGCGDGQSTRRDDDAVGPRDWDRDLIRDHNGPRSDRRQARKRIVYLPQCYRDDIDSGESNGSPIDGSGLDKCDPHPCIGANSLVFCYRGDDPMSARSLADDDEPIDHHGGCNLEVDALVLYDRSRVEWSEESEGNSRPYRHVYLQLPVDKRRQGEEENSNQHSTHRYHPDLSFQERD